MITKLAAIFSLLLCIQWSNVQADEDNPLLPSLEVITATNSSNLTLVRTLDHGYVATGVAFSPDGKTLVSGGGGLPILWNVQSGLMLEKLQAPIQGYMSSVAFSPDGQYIVATGLDSPHIEGSEGDVPVLCIWDVESRTLIAEMKGRGGQVGIDIGKVAFSPDGEQFAIANPASIWKTDQIVKAGLNQKIDETHLLLTGYEQEITVAYAPDGKTVATGSDDFDDNGNIRFWDAATGVQQSIIQLDKRAVWDVAFSSNGKMFAFANGHFKYRSEGFNIYDNPIISILNTQSGQVVWELKGHQDDINHIAFSPDSELLASAGNDGSARIWEVATGKQVGLLQEDDPVVWDVAFSPDGKLIATASRDGKVRLWGVPITH